MSDFELFDCFIGFLEEGATEKQALALTAYEQGLILKSEISELFGEPELNGLRRKGTRAWNIPEDPIERLVYLTIWNRWVKESICKIMSNCVVLSMRARNDPDAERAIVAHDFPQDIAELALQIQLNDILAIKGEQTYICRIQKVKRNRRAIFALQCLLKIPERKIFTLLDADGRPELEFHNASELKITKLKKTLRACGVLLSS